MESSIPAAKVWRFNKTRTHGWREQGKLVNWSVIFNGPVGMENVGHYVVGVVKLESGKQVMAQIVDVNESDLKMGMKCVGVLRRLVEVGDEAVICYGVCFAKELGR